MLRSFYTSRQWFVWAYGGGLLLLLALYAQVEFTVSINQWYGGFYNMLQKATEHKVEEFWGDMLKFAKIAFPYVLIATLTKLFHQALFLQMARGHDLFLCLEMAEGRGGGGGCQPAYPGGYLSFCPYC